MQAGAGVKEGRRIGWAVKAGAALALLLVCGMVTPRPASAQTPEPGADAGAGTGAGSGGGSLMEQVVPPTACAASGGAAAGAAPFPVSAYTIDYDEGGFTAVSRKAVGSLTEMTFATVRWVVSVGMWLVGWAFSFGFADRLAAPMSAVAGRYQSAFLVPLLGSALLVSAAYAGLQIFRGRIGRGAGEFGLSLVLVAVFATWLLSDPKAFLDASFRLTAQLSGSVATVALAGAPAGCTQAPGSYALPRLDAAVGPLAAQIQRSFVEQPYELLEWGAPVPPGCRPYRDAVLAAGAGGDRDRLVAAMDRPGCSALYRFNRDPSTERLGVAVLVLVAAAILMISLGLVAGSVVVAQIVAVGLIALMPFAALAAALPGAGRAAMWRWAAALLRALATIVAMSGFLTFLLLAGDALLRSTDGQSLLAQMATLNMVAVAGISLRHRMLHSGRRAATGIAHRLESAQPAQRAARRAELLGLTADLGEAPGFAAPAAGADDLARQVGASVARVRATSGIAGSGQA